MNTPRLPFYDHLLADKDLDDKTRTMIVKRMEEDTLEIAKEKAESKRQRLKSLADLSVLNPDPSLVAGKISGCLPGADVHAPRDGERPSETRDILFLATLLKDSKEFQSVLQCTPISGSGSWIFIAGECPPEGYVLKQRLTHKGIRRIFRERFYGFRRALSSPSAVCMNFSIGGIELRRSGGRGDKAFWEFAARLHHPFTRVKDSFLEELHTRPLLEFPTIACSKLFLCPLDGSVKAIQGKVTSPAWTWEKMVGRSWKVALCPKCLGDLALTGFTMN